VVRGPGYRVGKLNFQFILPESGPVERCELGTRLTLTLMRNILSIELGYAARRQMSATVICDGGGRRCPEGGTNVLHSGRPNRGVLISAASVRATSRLTAHRTRHNLHN